MKHNVLIAVSDIFLWYLAWQSARKGVVRRKIS